MREWFSQLWLRLRTLARRNQLDRDLDDEIAFHLAMREQKLGDPGSARRRFGNATSTKETARELWTFPLLESIWADLRYGARVLRRNPLFAAVAVLSLALGIGANTAVFTLIQAVMLEKLPVPAPNELVILNWSAKQVRDMWESNSFGYQDAKTGEWWRNVFPYGAFESFRNGTDQLSSVFAFTPLNRAAVRIGDRTDLVPGLLASGEYHQGMGARPLVGRLLNPADDKPGAEPVAVLSYRFWEQAFGRDPGVVGRGVTVNGIPVTIIGVTEPAFYGASAGGPVPPPDVTLPLAMTSEVAPRMGDGTLFTNGHAWWLNVMGRLRPGTTMEAAEVQLNGLLDQAVTAAGVEHERLRLHVSEGARGIASLRQSFAERLWTLMAATGLVLLIACTNLATLMLARAAARRGEITLRLAMGAGRWRLIRQLITESLLVSLTAGAAGAVLSYWGCRALLRWLSSGPMEVSLTPNPVVIAFLVALSVLAGVLFGLAPAIRASRVHLVSALKEGAGSVMGPGGRRHGGHLGQGFVVLQVALSLVLIVGAGLFLRTLQNLRNVDLGFRSDGILLFQVDPTLARYDGDRLLNFYRNLLARLAAAPGVVSATASRNRLITGGMSGGPAYVPGATWLEDGRVQAHINDIGARYFDTMGIPVLLGRGVSERDTADAARVVVVNEAFAKEAFPDGSVLGRTIVMWDKDRPPAKIVGVVANAHYTDVRREPPPTVYEPYEQNKWGVGGLNFALRTAGPPEAFVETARAVLREVDPNVPLSDVATQRRVIDDRLRNERLFANLATAFSVLALLLACIGIYGVVAFAVQQRTGEFGIRVALGAGAGNVLWLAIERTVRLVMAGVAAGLVGSYWFTKLLAGRLYGIEANDPATFASAAVVLVLVALAAGLLPASRAARIHPMDALRCE